MKFTTTLAVASLFSAVLVAATPIPYESEYEVESRDFSVRIQRYLFLCTSSLTTLNTVTGRGFPLSPQWSRTSDEEGR